MINPPLCVCVCADYRSSQWGRSFFSCLRRFCVAEGGGGTNRWSRLNTIKNQTTLCCSVLTARRGLRAVLLLLFSHETSAPLPCFSSSFLFPPILYCENERDREKRATETVFERIVTAESRWRSIRFEPRARSSAGRENTDNWNSEVYGRLVRRSSRFEDSGLHLLVARTDSYR